MSRKHSTKIFNLLLSITFLSGVFLLSACHSGGESSHESTTKAPSAASSVGSGSFEGMITMKMEGESQKGAEITYLLKGGHARVEMKTPDNPEYQGVMLWNLEDAKMITLIPSRKMYMTIDMKEAAENMKDMSKNMKKPQIEEEKFPQLTDTGREEIIAGHTCEHWLMGDKQNLDMCVAKGLGYFGMGGQGGGLGALKNLAFSPKLLAEAASHPEWVKFLEGGAFPLKVTSTEDGKIKMNMEATKIERKSIDDSLFAVPPDYKEFSMGGLGGGKP